MFLKPEPLSSILILPVNEQNVPFPLRLLVVGRDDILCIVVMFSIFCVVIIFLFVFLVVYKYSTNVNKPIGINNFFSLYFQSFFYGGDYHPFTSYFIVVEFDHFVPMTGFEPVGLIKDKGYEPHAIVHSATSAGIVSLGSHHLLVLLFYKLTSLIQVMCFY